MASTLTTPRPLSLKLICLAAIVVVFVTVAQLIRLYNLNPYATEADKGWYLFMIFWQLPIIFGIWLIYQLKRIGLWVFLLSKIIFLALPMSFNGDILGLFTPLIFLEGAAFFILFGKHERFLKR